MRHHLLAKLQKIEKYSLLDIGTAIFHSFEYIMEKGCGGGNLVESIKILF